MYDKKTFYVIKEKSEFIAHYENTVEKLPI